MNIIDEYLQELQAGKVLRKKSKTIINKVKKAAEIAAKNKNITKQKMNRRQFLKKSAHDVLNFATA